MRIYAKDGFVYVDLEGEEVITTILNEAPNVIVKGEKAAQQGVQLTGQFECKKCGCLNDGSEAWCWACKTPRN